MAIKIRNVSTFGLYIPALRGDIVAHGPDNLWVYDDDGQWHIQGEWYRKTKDFLEQWGDTLVEFMLPLSRFKNEDEDEDEDEVDDEDDDGIIEEVVT